MKPKPTARVCFRCGKPKGVICFRQDGGPVWAHLKCMIKFQKENKR